MTNTNPRDLIHGLARSVEILLEMRSADAKPMRITEKRLDEARAYLAQPEPEGPPELIRALELAEAALADIGDAEREFGDDLAWAEARAAQDLPRIRAVLARWCRPVFQQKELTDEQLLKCFKIATPCYNMEGWRRELDGMRVAIAADRTLCARPAIKPVPVSERPWERDGWCDGDGWCWWFDADDSDPCWVFDQPQFVIWTHCLPAHALPLPVPTQHGCTQLP